MENQEVKNIMTEERICVLIPSYHNEATLTDIVCRVKEYTNNIIVVLDGDPEKSLKLLRDADLHTEIVCYEHNKGKGTALKEGFARAIRMGYEYAITIDSDGQHFPEDIPLFIETFMQNKGAFIVGARDFSNPNMPHGNNFANKFSNFWFHFQTGISLADTQTGYRLYPLHMLNQGWFITSRYESELEFLVYSAWKGIKIISIPVQVYYPPQEERVSSFRPYRDFLRITAVNCFLTMGALLFYLPMRIIRKFKR